MKIDKSSSQKQIAEWNDEMVKKYHSEGTLYESKNLILRYVERQRIKTIIKLAQASREDRIIDIGCGEGYLLSLLPQTKQIVGLDISKIALVKAKKRLEGKTYIELIYATAQNTPFADNSFDKIVCSELLEHVPDPKAVIKEINRILNKKGKAVISVPDEQRIQNIVRVIKELGLAKRMHAARKQEDYEWHLHESNVDFVKEITKGYFKISKLIKLPFLLRYRLVVELTPL